MPKPKSSRNLGGRPTKYRAEFAARAVDLCRLGATNDDLAVSFGVGPATLGRWIKAHPEFRDALREGREDSDAAVASRLYQRAMGYPRKVEKVVVVDGEPTIVTITENVVPDVTAQIFWLKNRRPDKWRDKPAGSRPVAEPINDGLEIPGLDEELAG